MPGKIKTERELLDRIAYEGPLPGGEGQGATRIYDWSGAVTDAAIWTPESGNRWVISMISINTTAECTVTIFDEDDSEVDRLFKGIIEAKKTVIIPFPIPRTAREINRSLSITTSATGGYITVYGWETGLGELSTTTSVTTSTSSTSATTESTSSSSVTNTTSSTSSTSATTVSTSSTSATTVSTSSSSSSSSSSSTSSSSTSATTVSTSSSSHSITYL